MKVGVLALQGDFQAHVDLLEGSGVTALEVRTQAELVNCDALVIPGGESTSLRIIARNIGMLEPLRTWGADGRPVFGTCAGLIACAASVSGESEPILGHVNLEVERNAYGRQNESFEADIESEVFGDFKAVFIRAPRITKYSPEVEVLAEHQGDPIIVSIGTTLLLAFHPELTGDVRFHQHWLASFTKQAS